MAKSAEKIWKSCSNEYQAEVVSEGRDLTFGQFLRRERILRGISRDEVVRVFKVSIEYYDALEANLFDNVPPKAFVVGFLRAFSKYAGLDGDETVNRFLAQAGKAHPVHVKDTSGFIRKHYRKLLMYCGVACLIILMFMPLFRHID